ncbi:hypothetical protein SAMN05216553_101650 [Lentzea fradiae]|uniref:Uncharacterized protein n=1 Tax=Lentzea fradiae TaxID=200378 RepID=A0A1G7L3T4_9PSEU|nr:hypothetical protein SAMN05216553_101650 [Lentzea fradiae]
MSAEVVVDLSLTLPGWEGMPVDTDGCVQEVMPNQDGVGIIDAIGPGVMEFAVGGSGLDDPRCRVKPKAGTTQ